MSICVREHAAPRRRSNAALGALGALEALVVAAAVSACARPVPEIRIDGSPGLAPLLAAVADAYMREHPRAAVRLGAGLGSRARIDSLAAGAIDVAMASHGVDTAALRARGILAYEIARTPVVFAVHADVPERSVTPARVCDIYAGRLTRWTTGLPLTALMRPADEVDAEVALAAIPCLRQLTLAPTVAVIARADSMAAALASTPGAFGVTSLPYVQQSGGRLVALALDGVAPAEREVLSGSYPMTRRAVLLVRADTPAAVLRFLDFIRTEDGARILRANGAIPLPF